ncbi:ribonuclease G [Rhodobacteraceae bacterium SC52]|nr:ribonuclease G [Rhodobacteraceae bacterium SC52]
MKGSQILIDTLAGRPAAALMRDGQLDDLLIDPPDDVPRPGAIYRARVDRPMKGLGGRMLSIPGGSAFARQGQDLAAGASVLVQVTGYAEPGKAVPVTLKVLFKSRYCIVTPGAPGINLSRSIKDEDARARLRSVLDEFEFPEGVGVILRSAAQTAEDDAVADDLADTLDMALQVSGATKGGPELLLDGPSPDLLAWRDWSDVAASDVILEPGCFDTHGAAEAIDELRQPRVALPGGGHMYVEPTRALVAVDVNTGNDTSLAAGLKTNIAAIRELPRALRLLGLGGQIVIDFAPMAKKDRRSFEQTIRTALRTCPVETALVGWTPLGHFELSRKRERLPISVTLS